MCKIGLKCPYLIEKRIIMPKFKIRGSNVLLSKKGTVRVFSTLLCIVPLFLYLSAEWFVVVIWPFVFSGCDYSVCGTSVSMFK